MDEKRQLVWYKWFFGGNRLKIFDPLYRLQTKNYLNIFAYVLGKISKIVNPNSVVFK